MMFLRFLPFLLIFCLQYAAKAQSGPVSQKIKNAADSLANTNEFTKSEAMYLKALKVSDQDPLLHINLASLYLKMKRADKAKKFMESALIHGADMEILLADARIKSYLDVNPEEGIRFSSLSRSAKTSIQLEDKSKWVDDFRAAF